MGDPRNHNNQNDDVHSFRAGFDSSVISMAAQINALGGMGGKNSSARFLPKTTSLLATLPTKQYQKTLPSMKISSSLLHQSQSSSSKNDEIEFDMEMETLATLSPPSTQPTIVKVTRYNGNSIKFYISCWEVGSDPSEVVNDLLAAGAAGAASEIGDKTFSAIEIPSLDHALAVLSNLGLAVTKAPYPAHLIVRILCKEGHHAFGKVMTALANNSSSNNSSGSGGNYNNPILLSAARESKLTQVLTPLLCGNNRSWLVGHCSVLANDMKETITSMKILDLGRKIMCGCVKNDSELGASDLGKIRFLPAPVLGDKESPQNKARSSYKPYPLTNTVSAIEKTKHVSYSNEAGDDGDGTGDCERESDGNISDDSLGDAWLNNFKKRQNLSTATSSSSPNTPSPSPTPTPAEFEAKMDNLSRRRSYALTGGSPTPQGSAGKKVQKRPTAGMSFLFGNKKKLLEADGSLISGESDENGRGGGETHTKDSTSNKANKNGNFSGWLFKKGSFRHNWKLRYFELEGNLLKYYSNEKKSSSKGILDMTGGEVEAVKNEHHVNKFAFDLFLKDDFKKVRHLYAEDEIDRVQWLLMLEQACKGETRGGGGGDQMKKHEWSDDLDDSMEALQPLVVDEGGENENESENELSSFQTLEELANEAESSLIGALSSLRMPNLTMKANQVPPTLLQSNYDTLLTLLREERNVRGKMNGKIADLEQTLLETSAHYEVEVENMKLELSDLRHKNRHLTKESAHKEVFTQLEAEIDHLRSEAELLRQRNVKLEMQVFKKPLAVSASLDSIDMKNILNRPSNGMHYSDSVHTQLIRRVKTLEKTNEAMRAELHDLRRQSRMLTVSKAQNNHSHKSMNAMGSVLSLYKSQAGVGEGRARKLEQSQLMQAESECAHWRQAELVSQNEVQKLKLEVGKLKPMVESMRKKVNNNDKVQKFLDKHGSKSMVGGKNRSDGGKVLHDALMVLSATVRTGGGKYSEELSKTVDRVVKLIEEEVKVGRGREKELMLGMMELLDENKYNDEDQGEGGGGWKRSGGIGIGDRLLLK
ncbi:hypothetical protein ScalyP_jg5563 [Parmales sp. scaly parma]|nr:hypothetical protein ScalyP_jg5563 [Parmales sp. scaly parma]